MVVELENAVEAIRQYRASKGTWRILAHLLEKCTCVEGRHDKGKSMSLVAMSYQLREKFGRPVITIESTMGLKPAFGEYQHLPFKTFVEELKKISKVAKIGQNGLEPDEIQDAIDKALKKLGIKLMGATLVFDEANKLFEVGRWAAPDVMLMSYFIQQMAHYHNTVLIATPRRQDLTPRVRQQVDFWGRPSYDTLTKTCQLDFFRLARDKVMTLKINGERYFNLYDRWATVGFRDRSLNIKDEYL